MFDNLETVRMAHSMTAHAAERSKIVAANVANADTPGYRARDVVPFAQSYHAAGADPMRATRAGHFAGPDGPSAGIRMTEDKGGRSPNGNSVSLEAEMVKTAEIKRQHDLSLAVYKSSLTMMRSAMGRRG